MSHDNDYTLSLSTPLLLLLLFLLLLPFKQGREKIEMIEGTANTMTSVS